MISWYLSRRLLDTRQASDRAEEPGIGIDFVASWAEEKKRRRMTYHNCRKIAHYLDLPIHSLGST
jgi:hypothetical protein